MKLDVRGWPGEAEPGGEEREAVQHLARFEACVCVAVVGLALVALGSRFSIGELRRGIRYKKPRTNCMEAAYRTYTMYVSYPWTAPPAINQPAAPDPARCFKSPVDPAPAAQ